MTRVRTSPFYPQSNGKLERWLKSLEKRMHSLTSLTVEDAWRLIESYVDRYNTVRLRSAIAYVTPRVCREMIAVLPNRDRHEAHLPELLRSPANCPSSNPIRSGP